MRFFRLLACGRKQYRLPKIHQAVFDYKVTLRQIKKAKRLEKPDYKGRTILHIAAMKGHNPAIEEILEDAKRRGVHGMLINKADREGNTALHLASENGYNATIKLLINAGCDLTILNKRGELPLRWAINLHKSEDEIAIKNSQNGNQTSDSVHAAAAEKRASEESVSLPLKEVSREFALNPRQLGANDAMKEDVSSELEENEDVYWHFDKEKSDSSAQLKKMEVFGEVIELTENDPHEAIMEIGRDQIGMNARRKAARFYDNFPPWSVVIVGVAVLLLALNKLAGWQ